MTVRTLGVIAVLLAWLPTAPARADSVELSDSKTMLEARADGHKVLLYRKSNPTAFKPYIQQLYTPGGVQVIRDSVPDHKHHHGLMFAVAAEGVNFWEEVAGCGRQTTGPRLETTPFDTAKSRATFSSDVLWTKPNGEVALSELRVIDVFASPAIKPTLLTWRTRLEAPPGKSAVKLSGAHYYGLGMRLVQSMDKIGRFFNSDHAQGVAVGESQVTPARWCAYSARADGKPVTVALFAHPRNPRPTHFFSMSAPFAYLGATLNLWKEPLELKAGAPLDLRYGVAVWDGDTPESEVEKMCHTWIKLAQ